MNRRDSLKLLLAASRGSFLPPLRAADRELLASASSITVRTEVLIESVLRDAVLTPTDFRSIAMKDGQVAVNGQVVPVLGASLHKISERNFHAVRNDEIRRDMEGLRNIGFNSAFLAHYPHSQLAYDLADEMGLLVWA